MVAAEAGEEVGGEGFGAGGLLEEDQRRAGLAVDAVGLEDRDQQLRVALSPGLHTLPAADRAVDGG